MITTSPFLVCGNNTVSINSRNVFLSHGPSITSPSVLPSNFRKESMVIVFHEPGRLPKHLFLAQPRKGAMSVLAADSSMNISRSLWQSLLHCLHSILCSFISSRSCSLARKVFFKCVAKLFQRAAINAQTAYLSNSTHKHRNSN